jgi:Tol biopolymer transport system component
VTSIYTIGFDGTHKRRLTRNGRYVDIAPDFSPGGHRIAFGRQRPGRHYGIWVMHADGSDERMLTRPRGPYSNGPSFSPNGKKIAYEKAKGWQDIVVMRADGSEKRRIHKPGADLDPSWGARQ